MINKHTTVAVITVTGCKIPDRTDISFYLFITE